MAARLAGPRIPAGGVGLAIRARMTRPASCRRRARDTVGAIIQRPPGGREWQHGHAAGDLVLMTAGSSAEPGQQNTGRGSRVAS